MQLDVHEYQIISLIINPRDNFIEIVFDGYARASRILASGIQTFDLENANGISLLCEAGGEVDEAFLEENANGKRLEISGVIDYNGAKRKNENWKIAIAANEIIFETFESEREKVENFLRRYGEGSAVAPDAKNWNAE